MASPPALRNRLALPRRRGRAVLDRYSGAKAAGHACELSAQRWDGASEQVMLGPQRGAGARRESMTKVFVDHEDAGLSFRSRPRTATGSDMLPGLLGAKGV